MNRCDIATVTLLLLVSACCLFEFSLHGHVNLVREYEAAGLSLRWMLLLCLLVWCGVLMFLTRQIRDWGLIGFLLFATILYFFAKNPSTDVLLLVFGATLGRGTKLFLTNENGELYLLSGLIGLLTFSSWWHLDMSDNFYHGPRWMGLWNNPNDYGMLMSVGVLLAIGLLAASPKSKVQSPKSHWFLQIILFIAAGMMAVSIIFSYSRGAWLGTAVGLLYLAKHRNSESEKRKAKIIRYVLPVACLAAAVVIIFWHNTADNAPWYLKRADLSRPSAQHRVAAWKAGFEIMRDHPFGVGWNKTVEAYEKNYSPPEGGAAAITTNDYLMLGTQLGIPALLCFIAYVALCFRKTPRLTLALSPPIGSGEGKISSPATYHSSLQTACRAAVLAMLVEFWFDGGLFKLATASVFWILLELGSASISNRRRNAQTGTSAKRGFECLI